MSNHRLLFDQRNGPRRAADERRKRKFCERTTMLTSAAAVTSVFCSYIRRVGFVVGSICAAAAAFVPFRSVVCFIERSSLLCVVIGHDMRYSSILPRDDDDDDDKCAENYTENCAIWNIWFRRVSISYRLSYRGLYAPHYYAFNCG